jgi:hypothetical protein
MTQRTDSMTNYSRHLISSLTTVQEVLLEDFNVKIGEERQFQTNNLEMQFTRK